MIFNESGVGSTISLDDVKPSKYPLGLEGAYMHIYESECNWNAIMKSVGLSEMRYALDHNGEELFVNEAGALGGMISKIKAFFKKIFEKIKSIIKKIIMVINSFTMSDKKFVKKYEKDLRKVNMTDFEFNGYDFKKTDKFADDVVKKMEVDEEAELEAIEKIQKGDDEINIKTLKKVINSITQDDIDEAIEKGRGNIIGDGNKYTESEFREELRDKLYDEKENLDDKQIDILYCLRTITDTKENLKEISKLEKALTKLEKEIDKAYTRLEKEAYSDEKTQLASAKADDAKENIKETTNKYVKGIDIASKILKGCTSSYLIVTSMLSQRTKDRNRQCKAICIKALNYKPKNESAYYSNDTVSDIFSQVDFM